MKTLYKSMAIVSMCLILSHAQPLHAQCVVPNGGFEVWGDNDGFFLPNNFEGIGIGQTTDAQSGQYAVKMSNFQIFGIDVKASLFTFVPLNVAGCNRRPAFFTGYIKTRTDTLDSLTISLSVFKAGGEIIGIGAGENKQPRGSYTQFHIPIQYSSQELGDSVFIVIVSSSKFCTAKLDNIEFSPVARGINLSSGSVGINDPLVQEPLLHPYPNPAKDKVNLQYKLEGSTYSLKILNREGKTVYNKDGKASSSGIFTQTVDVSGLPNGIYLIQLTTGKNVYTKKLAIAR